MSTKTGFTIVKIMAQGQERPDAVLEFKPGLNVIAGASNTGKTYVWQLINYLLGSSRLPKNIPHSKGYSRSHIELHPLSGGSYTIQRSLVGGDALGYSVPIDDIAGTTPSELLGEQHSAKNPITISGRLLTYTDLTGRMIRQDKYGKKRSLSFRDIACFTLIDEERIIVERSPALTIRPTSATADKSIFGLFLTGQDDSEIVTRDKPKDRKLRLQLEMSILSGLLDDREARLKSYEVDMDQTVQMNEQYARLSDAIEEASRLVATRQDELNIAAEVRDKVWDELETLNSKQLFQSEQIKRLELLEKHYASDRARLESSLEAGELFISLPGGECPVCGHPALDSDELEGSSQRLMEFQQACTAELKRISELTSSLVNVLDELRKEDREHSQRQSELNARLEAANNEIAGLLNHKAKAASDQLSQLLAEKSRLSQVMFVATEVQDLRARYSNVEQQSKVKAPESKIAEKVNAAGTAEFCDVVEGILRAWKFPFQGKVSWADNEFDLVIGGANRGSMGKGYRAVTYAAFTIGLMRYCRQKNLQHPGIVMIDSPLNPFKGADQDGEERVNTEVQEAFYEDLASDTSGDQVIVFENTEPPVHTREKMTYTHFSGNVSRPRVGFFPVVI